MVSVLISASVERFFVSRKWDFLKQYFKKIEPNTSPANYKLFCNLLTGVKPTTQKFCDFFIKMYGVKGQHFKTSFTELAIFFLKDNPLSLNRPLGRCSLLSTVSVCCLSVYLCVCAIAENPLPGGLETSGQRAYR